MREECGGKREEMERGARNMTLALIHTRCGGVRKGGRTGGGGGGMTRREQGEGRGT